MKKRCHLIAKVTLTASSTSSGIHQTLFFKFARLELRSPLALIFSLLFYFKSVVELVSDRDETPELSANRK